VRKGGEMVAKELVGVVHGCIQNSQTFKNKENETLK